MALLRCTDCGTIVSSRAAICPACGCPIDLCVLHIFSWGFERAPFYFLKLWEYIFWQNIKKLPKGILIFLKFLTILYLTAK